MTDEWTYTNAEHTEARKGRFGALLVDGEWAVYHDDFPRYYYTPNNTLTKPRTKTKPYYELRVAWYEVVREFLAWHAAQPAPLAVGDYVRLTGEKWGEHMGKVVRVVRAESETEYAAVKIDGAEWYVTPNWTADRITVTADLDAPWSLPMPEVGEWVWVQKRNGDVLTGGRVENGTFDGGPVIQGDFIGPQPGMAFFVRSEAEWRDIDGEDDAIAWGLYDPADLTPDEPTTFGPVGEVTNPEGHDCWILRADDGTYTAVAKHDGLHVFEGGKWPDVLALGTFTAVER